MLPSLYFTIQASIIDEANSSLVSCDSWSTKMASEANEKTSLLQGNSRKRKSQARSDPWNHDGTDGGIYRKYDAVKFTEADETNIPR